MSIRTYKASCKCGSLNYYFTTELPPESWRVRKCNCSFCKQRTTHIHASDPNGSVRYEFVNPEHLNRYRFGTKTADFLTCSNCDSYMGAVMTIEGRTYAVLNVEHMVEKLLLPTALEMSFEGESLEERLARRTTGWTPVSGEM